MKKFVSLIIVFMLLITAIGVSAAYKDFPSRYDEVVDGGRAAQNMPLPFSVENLTHKWVAGTDFESDYASDTLSQTTVNKTWYSREDGALKIVKEPFVDDPEDDTDKPTAYSFKMKYQPAGGFVAGDTYAFKCKIKTVGVAGGYPRNIMSAYSSTGWLKETNGYNAQKHDGDTDWYEMTQTIQIPEGTAYLYLTAYLAADLSGTVYFDDFELYRLGIDPLESVLCSPNYKGLIYGDGYSDIDLDVTLSAQSGFYDLENMELSVRLIDENDVVYRSSEAKALTSRMNFVFSSAGLNEGDYYLQTILKDKQSGEVVSKKEHTIRKRASDYRPAVYLDENGHIIKNGEKTFLKRIYVNGVFSEVAADAVSAKQENGGKNVVDTISNYGAQWWATTPLSDKVQGAIDSLRNNGITSHICLSGYWYSSLSGTGAKTFIKKQEDLLPFLTTVANDYKNDSVFEGYYLFDEPDPINVGEEIRWHNEILAQADIDHPTFGVADSGHSYYGIYTKMTDILGIDPYPLIKADDDGNELPTDFARVGRSMREIKKNFPNRPVYIVLEGFHYDERNALRSPNRQELRNMAWQAVCEGAEGFDWFEYAEMKYNDTTKDFDTWWSDFKAIYTEVDNYKDIILSDEPAPLYSVTNGGDWLNISLKRYNGKTYLFAVNNTQYENAATVAINGAGAYNLNFEPLEVKIQEISQAAYLSPLAELKSIEFSNGKESFAVSEDDENILYVHENNGVINYTANISENAKLYIGSVEVNKKGKITVRNVDSFTVTVVAQDGVTKSTKNYRVVKH